MPTAVHVALLRGINVGGRNKLPMAELREVFARAGANEVRTYIQSGNVLFRAPSGLARKLPATIADALERRFSLKVPVILRSAEELIAAAERNPFLEAEVDTGALHVMFLAEKPARGAAASLDPRRSPPDEFALGEREVYLRCPNGVADTKLTNDYFDRTLGTVSTGRNWRTVLKLIDLAST